MSESNTPTVHTVETATPARRKYVALDLETTTLDRRFAHVLEVAAVEFDPDTGAYLDVLSFVPHHQPDVVHRADPGALAVNRYYERRLFESMLSPVDSSAAVDKLLAMLDGATLVCANPSYDSIVLWCWLAEQRPDLAREPWKFRHYDVSLATATELCLESIPGLRECAQLWDLVNDEGRWSAARGSWHSAAFDAFVAADVCSAVEQSKRARSLAKFAAAAGAGDE